MLGSRIRRVEALSGWTADQRNVVIASFLGWTIDAFDFFLLVFVIRNIAEDFGTDIPDVAFAILLTLAMRPIGAFVFGRGRRPLWPPADADGQCRALLVARVRFGICAELDRFSGAACALRRRHGLRMGNGSGADHGEAA